MEYTTESKVDETASLRHEVACLTARLRDAEDATCKMEQINKTLNGEISDLKFKVKFLEGQIEAYQYCLNCRR